MFIDPVTTGFSRAAPGENDAQFHGFDGDLESVAEFIRLVSDALRALGVAQVSGRAKVTAPRARPALSQYLLDNDGIYLNGITLISSVLNFETISFAPGNDLPYALFLPSYTATAWYHKKLPQGSARRPGESARRIAPLRGQRIQRGADEGRQADRRRADQRREADWRA